MFETELICDSFLNLFVTTVVRRHLLIRVSVFSTRATTRCKGVVAGFAFTETL